MGIFRRDKTAGQITARPVGTEQIGSIGARRFVRVAGEVSRIRTKPARGIPSLCVQVSDGTGTVVALWTGRRAIGGVVLGRSILLEGVASDSPDGLTFMNPSYELL